jgi:hypothetical protein
LRRFVNIISLSRPACAKSHGSPSLTMFFFQGLPIFANNFKWHATHALLKSLYTWLT